MLRDNNLVPLSRQHQHALALCVRIERASPIPESDLGAWQKEIAHHFRAEIRVHFVAEEQVVFPPARGFPEMTLLVDDLVSQHAWLRDCFDKAEAQRLCAAEITEFSRRLSEHIRKEERQLFEGLQRLMGREQLAVMGSELEKALKVAEQVCVVPARKHQRT
ncbi:MAG TPA: hemerythrin domain-containing protein [Candidatus Sulfotelmatobacter sp.]|nr:hemerythrin domain-containing protein [Candidatus Sulfotelmatobacter sp.]